MQIQFPVYCHDDTEIGGCSIRRVFPAKGGISRLSSDELLRRRAVAHISTNQQDRGNGEIVGHDTYSQQF